MNAAIWENLKILNDRRMRHVSKSRREPWDKIDGPALKPLPEKRYEHAEWK